MPDWLGYSIYSSYNPGTGVSSFLPAKEKVPLSDQNPSTSISFSLAANEKGPPSDLESHELT